MNVLTELKCKKCGWEPPAGVEYQVHRNGHTHGETIPFAVRVQLLTNHLLEHLL